MWRGRELSKDIILGLTFPAPTGPITANNSPGLTVKERPCRVGVSDAYKAKFKKYAHFNKVTQVTPKRKENHSH